MLEQPNEVNAALSDLAERAASAGTPAKKTTKKTTRTRNRAAKEQVAS